MSGWSRVSGRCPACGTGSLFVAAGDFITCGFAKCSDPSFVADLLENGRAHMLDVLTCKDPAGAFAHLLYLHGPEALGLGLFDMRDLDIDAVGRCSFPEHEPPYTVLPEASETWG